jgi:DNA polymerase III delta subunit
MLYIIYGNDSKKKRNKLNEIISETEVVNLKKVEITSEILLSYSDQASLFGQKSSIVIEGFFEEKVVLNKETIKNLNSSNNNFIFYENEVLVSELKSFKSYADIEKFELSKIKAKEENNFKLADLYAKKDKLGAWDFYLSLVDQGVPAEAIIGIIFWKIKAIASSGRFSPFTLNELQQNSSRLIDIYHLSHRGEMDMNIALEEFILESLS